MILLNCLQQKSHRFEAAIVVANDAMPSNRGNSTKRSRGEILTPRRRNQDSENRVPDEADELMLKNDDNNPNGDQSVDVVDRAVSEGGHIDNNLSSGKSDDISNNNNTETNIGNEQERNERISSGSGPAHISIMDQDNVENGLNISAADSSHGIKRKYDKVDKINNEQNIEVLRDIKMKGLLEHRKFYLTRIRQARASVQKRIRNNTKENSEYQSLSESNEIEQHRELVKQATFSTKKHQTIGGVDTQQSELVLENSQLVATDGSVMKQQKLSLRRGASVGRRMSAALIALAPGSASAIAANSGQTNVNVVQGSFDVSSKPELSSSNALLNQQTTNFSTNNKMRNVAPPSTVGSTISNTIPSRSQYHSDLPKNKNNTQATSIKNSAVGQKIFKVGHHTGRNAIGIKTNNLMRSSSPTSEYDHSTNATNSKFKRSKESIHPFGSKSAHLPAANPNQLAAPLTICPQSMVLRKKKKKVSNKLAKLLAEHERNTFSTDRRTDSIAGTKGTKDVIRRHSDMSIVPPQLPPEPAIVPTRRRTHWDVVLEEMRWMSNDFVEERKWKFATASLVAAEIIQFGRNLSESNTCDTAEVQSIVSFCDSSLNFMTSRLFKEERALVWNAFETSRVDEVHSKAAATKISLMVSEIFKLKTLQGATLDMPQTESTIADEAIVVPSLSQGDDALPTKDKMYQLASTHIENVANKLQDINKVRMSAVADVVSYELQLVQTQHRLIHEIEQKWKESESGTILYGPARSGKTITVSALIWRNRHSGPQLVVCSNFNRIRWKHELNRFGSLRIFTNGANFECNETAPCDVIVCEYSSFTQLSHELLRKFITVVIDCRYPSFNFGSDSEVKKSNCLQLLSPGWWSHFMAIGASSGRGHLILNSHGAEEDLALSGKIAKRDVALLLSSRVSFLYGSKCFRCEHFSSDKAVLAWIRFRMNDAKISSTKLGNVREFVSSLLRPLCSQATQLIAVLQPITWDLRAIEMTTEQLLAYQMSCRNVHSILSNHPSPTDNATNSAALIANAMMLLRRNCTHSRLSSLVSKYHMDSNSHSKSCIGPQREFGNAAQPNAHVVQSILKGSNKMQHLLALLSDEGDFVSILNEWLVPNSCSNCQNGKLAKSRRIVVLASLPEVQIMTSMLFNAIGIVHQLFLRSSSPNLAESQKFEFEMLSWLDSQLKLSNFNQLWNLREGSTLILVTSPLAIGCEVGGLGIELADTVICIDSDWSGKEEYLLNEIFQRCTVRRTMESLQDCRFIKILSKSTCEDAFLNPIIQDKESSYPSPDVRHTNAFGVYTLPKHTFTPSSPDHLQTLMSTSPRKGTFTFPCRSLLAFRLSNQAEILGTRKSDYSCNLQFLLPLAEHPQQLGFVEAFLLAEESSLVLKNQKFDFVLPPLVWSHTAENHDLRSASIMMYMRHFLTTVAEIDTETALSYHRETQIDTILEDSIFTHPLMLSYVSNVTTVNPVRQCNAFTEVSNKAARRANFFSSTYSTAVVAADYYDGNQGLEGMLYCPPLFPGMLECSDMARENVYNLQDQNFLRKLETKRLRLDVMTATGDMPRCQDSINGIQYVTEEESSHTDAASVLCDFSDDFGMAGIGAISLPIDSSLIAATRTTDVAVESNANSYDALVSYSDFEEISTDKRQVPVLRNESLMLLIVSRKRSWNETNSINLLQSNRSLSGSNAYHFDSLQTRNAIPKATHSYFLHHSRASVKRKRKLSYSKESHESSNSVLDNFPEIATSGLAQRVLTSLKQSSTGGTIFESELFRVASIRAKNLVLDRILRNIWVPGTSNDQGPGLPLACSEAGTAAIGFRGMLHVDSSMWTSIVKRLKNREAMTGGLALQTSTSQLASFRRSHHSPCRVDFGPFNVGFISAVNGLTVVVANTPRMGISLPMGVNVVHTGTGSPLFQWTISETEKLRRCVWTYGRNWILASRTLSGFCQFSNSSSIESNNSSVQRSPRSCRDRCQYHLSEELTERPLFEKSQSLARQAGIDVSEVATCVVPNNPIFVKGFHPSSLSSDVEILQTSPLVERDATNLKDSKRRRSFNSVLTAKKKTTTIPLAIPGIPAGNTPQLVNIHKSHEDTIQNAVAVAWSGGRTEMWPIVLLDVWDRQRNAGGTDSNAVAGLQARPASRQHQIPSTSTTSPSTMPSHRSQSTASQHPTNPSYPPMPLNQGVSTSASPARPNQMRPNLHPLSRPSQPNPSSRQSPHHTIDGAPHKHH